jgi:hypothetical protein
MHKGLEMSGSRYDGKPLLRLLEFYVLKAIGELSQSDEEKLVHIAPRLHALYGGNGEWHEAIAASMEMPSDMQALIRETWRKDLDIAAAHGAAALLPEEFAKLFVDANFVPSSDPTS